MSRSHPGAVQTCARMPIDIPLFGATLALVVIGIWMVLDTSYVRSLDNPEHGYDAFFLVRRQAVGAVVGMCALFWMMRTDYWRLRRLAVPGMLVGVVLLCCVWVPGIGKELNHAHRWVDLGPVTFQPSEVAKFTLLLYLAAILSRPDRNVRYLGEKGLSAPLLVAGVYLLLIEREPDLGTAFVLFLAVLTQLFLAGARKRHLLLILLICGLAVLLYGLRGDGIGHRAGRLTAFVNPDHDRQGIGFQVYHARLAIGSGGWFGQGLGQSREKSYIPQANSDFVFATLAEELGFVRTVPVITLLFIVGWRGFRIAWCTRDRFGALLAGGIAALISWQAIVNIAVATAAIPATGVPLPFISHGSTALVLTMAGVGVLLNIAQYPVPPAEASDLSRARKSNGSAPGNAGAIHPRGAV
ncbi:MAG: putative peptidoglycan glycosyltransferase FtsW [Chloroherpetonaceae bacterium]|nr:putative lipid II flippase FtsW [Chthonomonadaceae bacterium]MDW8208441.1 putative peptidoglycan glycosyltransferase FtsW [Chloroherpetonaceae bacterium]